FRPAYMIDQSHNIKDPIEDLLQTVDQLQLAYAKAQLVDHAALAAHQESGDVLLAERALKDAFETDARPLVAEARRRAGAALATALDMAPTLQSVSVDSWAVDYVPLGADGAPLRLPYAYRDPRTRGRLAEVFRRIAADRLYAVTGIQFLDFNTLPQIVSDLIDEPDVVARTETRLLI